MNFSDRSWTSFSLWCISFERFRLCALSRSLLDNALVKCLFHFLTRYFKTIFIIIHPFSSSMHVMALNFMNGTNSYRTNKNIPEFLGTNSLRIIPPHRHEVRQSQINKTISFAITNELPWLRILNPGTTKKTRILRLFSISEPLHYWSQGV